MFYESDLEQMLVDTISQNGWSYIPAAELPRLHADVMVEPMVRDALIRLNPEIAAKPEYADDVIYKLRAIILSVQPHNLVTQNEQFKKNDIRGKFLSVRQRRAYDTYSLFRNGCGL